MTTSGAGLGPSLVRTLVPIVIGPVIARFGFDPDDPETLLIISGVVSYLYYVLIRLCETKYPSLGYLLGIAKAPAYSPKDPPQPAPQIEEHDDTMQFPQVAEVEVIYLDEPEQTDNGPKDGDDTHPEQAEPFTGEMR